MMNYKVTCITFLLPVTNEDTWLFRSSGRRDALPEKGDITCRPPKISLIWPNYDIRNAMLIIIKEPVLELGWNPKLHGLQRREADMWAALEFSWERERRNAEWSHHEPSPWHWICFLLLITSQKMKSRAMMIVRLERATLELWTRKDSEQGEGGACFQRFCVRLRTVEQSLRNACLLTD